MTKFKLSGLFFWRKKKQTDAERAEDMLKLYMKHLPEIRKVMSSNQMASSDGQLIGQMYDYFKDAETTGRHAVVPFRADWDGELTATVNADGSQMYTEQDKRIKKKPVEVMEELERVPTPFNIEACDLDEKINTLKDKSRLSNQRFVKEQVEGMKKRLENRKRYKEFVEFYGKFPNTTDDKIDDLIKKYKLEFNTSDLFVPAFPKEAIEIMTKYTDETEKLCGEAPVFYVIAEADDFKDKRKKLDPILLVQSPFGFYWQILGAWDKEMILLSEL